MHPKTVAFLDELATTKWFSKVGMSDQSGNSVDTIFVSNWDEAIAYCTEQTYDDASLEAVNQISMYLHEHHREKYQLWNDKVAEIKPKTATLIRTKKSEAIKENRAPRNLADSPFSGDILHICIALEYSDLYQSEYYTKLVYWYLNGHFPCGWEGEVPEDFEGAFQVGKLVVF